MKTIKSLLTVLVSLLIIICIIPVVLLLLGIGSASVMLFGDLVIVGFAIIGVVLLVKLLKK
jgi:hypothetical protein